MEGPEAGPELRFGQRPQKILQRGDARKVSFVDGKTGGQQEDVGQRGSGAVTVAVLGATTQKCG